MKRRGGKSRLVKHLLPMIPEHVCYVELFGGAAHFLFGKPPSKVEVYNDLDDQLHNFFRVAKTQPDALIAALDLTLPSRKHFDEIKRTRDEDPVQDAANFYYLMKNAFAGRLDNPCFGISAVSKSRFDPLQVQEDVRLIYDRLAASSCYVESGDFETVFKRYDRPTTFTYLDPPYYGTDGYGDLDMMPDDFLRLRDMLASAKGKWLLSINDCEQVRAMFTGLPGVTIQAVETSYSSASGEDGRGRVQELLIFNYDLSGGAGRGEVAADEVVGCHPDSRDADELAS